MAKPKLALIPAAQGSKLFSVLPSSGVGDFDFSRSGSATRINSQGLIEEVSNGQSRLNYPMIDGKVVGCPHHILEPQRTNLITYSEDFSQSYWTKNGSSVTGSFVSPDGTNNATKLVENSSNADHQIYRNVVTTTGSFSSTIFVKPAERSKIRFSNGSNTFVVKFDLSNGTIISQVGATGNIVSMLNGWYKCTISWSVGSSSRQDFFVGILDDNGNVIYQGNGSSGVYIWGAQLEQGSFATSYIPTNGSTVTRSAETATGSGDAATFNDSEGVLMAEISALADDSSLRTITLGDNSSSNAVSIRLDNANLINIYVNSGGANQCAFTSNISTSLINKCLIKYKANDFSAWVNGFKIGVDTSGIIFPNGTLNRLNFDIGYGSTSPFYGNTKQIQYYDSALTDSELEKISSWTSFTDMAEGQLYTIE
jgi:hypothetical protein